MAKIPEFQLPWYAVLLMGLGLIGLGALLFWLIAPSDSDLMEKFDRMEQQVDSLQRQNEALRELATMQNQELEKAERYIDEADSLLALGRRLRQEEVAGMEARRDSIQQDRDSLIVIRARLDSSLQDLLKPR